MSGESNGGHYDVFPYKYYGYAKAPRNTSERQPGTIQSIEAAKQTQPVAERVLRPRFVCLMNDDGNVTIEDVETWTTTHPGESLDYIVVAYTTEQFSHSSNDDMEALHTLAQRATKDAGLQAYWIGCSCMPDEKQMEADVYRISDVIRGAKALVIATGPSGTARSTEQMLQQWGSRMWTYPEVLLSPSSDIKVYTRGGKNVKTYAKRQFAATVWTDAVISRQLIDHYEGNLLLSRLELVTLALMCLHSRETSEYLPGDHSYALMGLLRLRPKVDSTDSAFQAFARLSLANDSDMLLERLIFTLPKSPEQHWSQMDDAWDVKLWDIYPTCQVAGVGNDDTVIIVRIYSLDLRISLTTLRMGCAARAFAGNASPESRILEEIHCSGRFCNGCFMRRLSIYCLESQS